MARKEDLRFVRTNRKLYETFYEMISDTIAEDLSVTDICEAANINRATFYKHFNDRKEFVFYCVSQKLREIRLEQTGREYVNQATLYEDSVREIFAFLRYMSAINTENLTPGKMTVHEIYDAMTHHYMQEFTHFYTKTKRAEQVDPKQLAAYRVGAFMNVAFHALMQGAEHISEHSCEEFIRAFVTRIYESER